MIHFLFLFGTTHPQMYVNPNRFLSKSFEDLQAELKSNAEMYDDCIQSYEKEATEKDNRIQELEEELNAANEKILQLEARIIELTNELETERDINANLTATVSELQKELDSAQKNAGGFDNIEAILRKEVETYKSKLSEANDETASYKKKMIELEELIRKTKDSLVEERNRVAEDMAKKDTSIAQLDRELAEKLNEIHTTNAALEETNVQLTEMTTKFNTEKDLTSALDKKIQKLNQVTANTITGDSSQEVDRLTKLLEDLTKSNDEYKSLLSTYEDKAKLLSQELLLSGQSVATKQGQIENLRQELAEATSKQQVTVENRKSTTDEAVSLKAKLDEVQSKSTMWKAQANGMIIQLTNDLKEKDASMIKLQDKLDKLSEEQQQQEQQQLNITSGNNEALEKEIALLKAAMEDAQMKAKEKMRHKNQSLKELEDSVAVLSAEMDDLRREKDQITDRLNEEIQRGKDMYKIHERQLHESEDRLAKQHIAEMTKIEDEMNATIHDLEMEVKSLRDEMSSTGSSPSDGKAATVPNDYLKVQEMEEALRRSREAEVALINDNMKMKKRLDTLAKEKSLPEPASVFNDESIDDDETEKEVVKLPKYYKEKQRPVVIRIVNSAWNKLFRRKKL